MQRIKDRYRKRQKPIDIHESDITKFELDCFDENKQGWWNGRQIQNAFQTALALAELEAHGEDDENSQARSFALRNRSGCVQRLHGVPQSNLRHRFCSTRSRESVEVRHLRSTEDSNLLTTRFRREDSRPTYDPWKSPQYPQDYSYDRGGMPYRPEQNGHPMTEDYRYQSQRFGRDPGPSHPWDPTTTGASRYAHRPTGPLSSPLGSSYSAGPSPERHDVTWHGRPWSGESRVDLSEGEYRSSFSREPVRERVPGSGPAYPSVNPES